MSTGPRQLALCGALAATLAATAWVATQPEEAAATAAVVQPAHRRAATASAVPATLASSPTTAASADPVRQPWAEAPPEQFAAWQPPPPPPPPPAPPPPPPIAAAPPPPMAPPMTYQMIGRLVEGEGAKAIEVALLADSNSTLSVRRGDVIDGQWRVEQVSASGVSLVWLPAKLPQMIVFRPVP